MRKRAKEEKVTHEERPKKKERRKIESSFRLSPEREQREQIIERRGSIRNQPSGERRRSSIKSEPHDDSTVFARAAPPVDLMKKKRVIVIHGDPTKPNDILPGGKWDEDDFEAIETFKKALQNMNDEYEFEFKTNHDTLISDLQTIAKEGSCDLVLQLCDEGYMNNAKMELHVTALLEMVGLPYTGTGPIALGMTNDKQIVLEIAKSLGIPVPHSVYVEKDEMAMELLAKNNLEFPVFVKPNSTDGSFGITTKSICRNEEDLKEALQMVREQFHISGPVLIQEFLEGDDLNTGIIGNPSGKLEFLPVTQEDYSEVPPELPRILGFEAKWDENSPYFKIGTKKANISDSVRDLMNDCSARLFKRIGFRDYARFDWKMDKHGKPRLLEGNCNCGWSYDAHLQRMCALADITYSQMLRMILDAACDRLAAHAKQAQNEKKFVHLADVSAVRYAEKQLPTSLIEPPKL